LFRAGLEAGKVPSKESGNKKPLKSTLVQKSMKLLLPTCHTHTPRTPRTPHLAAGLRGQPLPTKEVQQTTFVSGKSCVKENM